MRWVNLFALCAAVLFWHFSSVEANGQRWQGPIVNDTFDLVNSRVNTQ